MRATGGQREEMDMNDIAATEAICFKETFKIMKIAEYLKIVKKIVARRPVSSWKFAAIPGDAVRGIISTPPAPPNKKYCLKHTC